MTKVISLSDKAYEALKGLKKPGDSFSDVVLSIAKDTRKGILQFSGRWHGSREEMDEIFSRVLSERKKSRPRELDF
ncbi:MAG: antitoxin VapB family protein [Candidatus Aenigmarchaeota archaeon]|nr:antitoxin VapB family protein [Candidatus Aenigmarchaeota archaeon]